MSTASQFTGTRPTRSIVNLCSSGGASLPANSAIGRSILSGALTANTLKTLLTVTGSGEFHFLGAYAVDTTSRTIRLKVTIDGTVVFDATTSAVTAINAGCLATGALILASAQYNVGPPIRFNASALIEVASSLSETDKVGLSYILHGT